MHRHRLLALAAVLLAASLAMAGNGLIPIYTITTITEAGSYIVTRDFSGAGGTGIQVEANDVTIDLAGHTLSNTGFGTAIFIENGATDITIRNGRIRGYHFAVSAAAEATDLRLRIEGVEIEDVNRGLNIISPTHVTVTDCRFTNIEWEAIYLGNTTTSGAFAARIVGNDFHGIGYSGIKALGINGGEIRDNTITDYGLASNGKIAGILLGPAGDNTVEVGGTLITGNAISEGVGTAAYAGILLDPYRGQDRIIANNLTSTGTYGVRTDSDYSRVDSNHISDVASAAVYVLGYGCLVQDNTLIAANYGIYFNSAGGGGIYRDNVAIDIGSAAVSGTATDGGGNVFP